VQEPLLEAVEGTEAPGGAEGLKPQHGHTDAVMAICITDSGAVMTAGLDRRLCVFHFGRPDAVRRVERAHAHGVVSVAHNSRANWFVTGGYDGAMKVRCALCAVRCALCGDAHKMAEHTRSLRGHILGVCASADHRAARHAARNVTTAAATGP
jgi:WD domain, G-beta repeat